MLKIWALAENHPVVIKRVQKKRRPLLNGQEWTHLCPNTEVTAHFMGAKVPL
jgi:hypothetical protein